MKKLIAFLVTTSFYIKEVERGKTDITFQVFFRKWHPIYWIYKIVKRNEKAF